MRLALSLQAYNLGNLGRRLKDTSLISLQQALGKTGGRLVKHALYCWLRLAESHLNRRRLGEMLGRIAFLPVPKGSGMLSSL